MTIGFAIHLWKIWPFEISMDILECVLLKNHGIGGIVPGMAQ